jgi:glycerol-3-phosphate dehydrogenase
MSLRSTHLDRMRDGTFDTLIIGGGINGHRCVARWPWRQRRID